MNPRKQTFIKLDCREHLLRPGTSGNIEQQSSRSIGDIGRFVSAESQPNVVFRQKDATHCSPQFRLAIAYPKHLWQRKTGESRIAGQLNKPLGADLAGERFTLRISSLIAPDD